MKARGTSPHPIRIMSNITIPVIAAWALPTNHVSAQSGSAHQAWRAEIFDLTKEPTEEYGATLAADGWVGGPMMKIVGEFEASLKMFPPIAPGTLDPYTPLSVR